MSATKTIDPAEALKRIIDVAAEKYRRKRIKRGPFWGEISALTGYGSTYSARLAWQHGFHGDTGEIDNPPQKEPNGR